MKMKKRTPSPLTKSFIGTGKYFNEVTLHLYRNSQKALEYGDCKAWDNVKGKGQKKYMPRGKVFTRLEQLNTTKWFNKLQTDIEAMVDGYRAGGDNANT